MRGRSFLPSFEGVSRIALGRVPEPARTRIYSGLVPESGRAFRQMMMGAVRPDAARVHCPVLCLGGDEDGVISGRLLRRTARHYGADLTVLPGHAHWLMEETDWVQAADAMLAWLERRGLGERTAA